MIVVRIVVQAACLIVGTHALRNFNGVNIRANAMISCMSEKSNLDENPMIML